MCLFSFWKAIINLNEKTEHQNSAVSLVYALLADEAP